MDNNNNFSALAVQNTIHLMNGDQHLNIQKDTNPELFETVFKLIEEGNVDELKTRFGDIKAELEKYTKGNFIKGAGGHMFMKGDDEAIPMMLARKLLKFHDENLDFMPLVRFWKKLKLNPSNEVKEHLYAFLEHNNIPVTELGDVICEKGVKQLEDGTLVDIHTQKIDNSIGMIVIMDRDKVDDDRHQTCSFGLHVGAPDYVRNHWNSDVIVDVEVSPTDFVAIPSDYNNTKARVCRYKVLGLSKETKNGLLYKVEFNIKQDLPVTEVSIPVKIDKVKQQKVSKPKDLIPVLKQGRYYTGITKNGNEEMIFIFNGKDDIDMLNVTKETFTKISLLKTDWLKAELLNKSDMITWMNSCIVGEAFVQKQDIIKVLSDFTKKTAKEIVEYVSFKTDLWQGADIKKMGKDKKALIKKAIYNLYTYKK